ncbi:predicted protein [Arabidopsis lyrata subsp. lyrata]|uniref:Predicted protein n=1 Tax=Arabidopsis lyrata subsp. lyrata TaxID=81972 RepID=D7L5N1_ARALL|nr:predicted protein [Arabidopsis lyrata subsp. lyrata]
MWHGESSCGTVWNLWLRHSTWIDQGLNHTHMDSFGLGYKSYNNKGSYKIVANSGRKENPTKSLLTNDNP